MFDPQVIEWCERWLGVIPVAPLFDIHKISDVRGMRLSDGREIVMKIRAAEPRIGSCVAVQRHLWDEGFPVAEPLTEVHPFGDHIASAERFVAGGVPLGRGEDAARRYAEELARAVRLAPAPGDVGTLEPAPYWLNWDHSLPAMWPPDPNVDLNSRAGPDWLDRAAERARRRLAASTSLPTVVTHSDWESQNLRWDGDALLVAHDWDSAVARPEALVAGCSSLMFPSTGPTNEPASLGESLAFLDAYQSERRRPFSPAELEVAWAASVWIGAWKAKKATYYGDTGIVLTDFAPQVEERLRRARA